MSTTEIVGSAWGERPPASASALVRTYVSRLRRVLGSEAMESRRARGGYRLRLQPDQLDVTHFRERVEQARRRSRDGDQTAGASLLADALGLWHGEALGGVPGPGAERERVGLNAVRQAAEVERFQLELQLGRHAAVLPDLVAAVQGQPLREDLAGLLMLAQDRCGRCAEALATFERTSARLRCDLGVEPSTALRERHREILASSRR